MDNKFPCPKCGSYDIKISYATISGLDMPTAVYGFTKYDYVCHKVWRFWISLDLTS